MRGRCVLWGAPWESSGSSWAIVLDLGIVVFLESLGPLWCALRFVGYVRVCLVQWVTPLGRQGSLGSLWCAIEVDGFIRGRWSVWGAPWVSSGSSGITDLIGVHPAGRPVRPGSFGCILGVVWVAGFIVVRPRDRRVSHDSLWCTLRVVGFIEVRPGGGRGHLGSLCSLGCALGVVRSV